MTVINDPSARVQVVGRGDLLHPGTCMLCGSGVCDEGYVDLGVYYDYEGQMYLCATCMKQTINAVGGMVPAEVELLQELVNSVQMENIRLKVELEESNERLRNYDAALASAFNVPTPNSTPLGLVSLPVEPDNEPVVAEVTEPADSGESEVTEPVVSSGEHSVPSGTRRFNLT